MYNSLELAKYFIHKSIPNTIENITNLKLQKLLYYAQGHYLSENHGERLFKEPIEAWVHGPVVREVYKKYSSYDFNEIKNDITEQEIKSLSIDSETITFLERVWDKYKKFNGKQLEFKTHQEEPWLKIRKGLPNYIYTDDEMEISIIKDYFDKHHQLTVS
ncbi:Panacea domain-containing protein [Virgibacillus sp. FSP13]